MSAIILAISFFASCSQVPTNFKIDEQGLTKLLNDKSYREDFIGNWDMTMCFKNDFSTRYRYQDSLIRLEILGEDGYILSINNLEFLEFKKLVSQLEEKYDSQDIRELEGFEKHLGMYDLSFGQYFSNDKFEIAVMIANDKSHDIYSITVNRAGS